MRCEHLAAVVVSISSSTDRQVVREIVRKARDVLKSGHGYLSLTNMADLFVEVRDHDIVVRGTEMDHSVTYRRMPHKPMLVALDPILADPDAEKARFLVEAWKAAYAKAKALGWL